MEESTRDGSQCRGYPMDQSGSETNQGEFKDGITETDPRTVDLSDSKEKTSSQQELYTANQGCEMTTRRKLNCNLCANIFTTMFGLNAHMKTHPEVVFFVLQLLDGGTADREGIAEEAEQDDDSAEASQIIVESTTETRKDTRKSLRRKPREKKLKSEQDNEDNITKEKALPRKRRTRGRPPKAKKPSRIVEQNSRSLIPPKKQDYNGKIKSEPGISSQESERKIATSDQRDKGYNCKVCNKSFNSLSGRYLHEKKHTGKYKLKCEKCGKGFNSNHHLEQHMNAHNRIKPFACSKCTKKFASKQKWKLHENKCDPNQPKPVPQYMQAPEQNPCNYCGKIFLRPDSLKSHIAVQHTEGGKTRFKCDQCGRRFSQKGALKVHQNNPKACLRDILTDRAPGVPFVDELLPGTDSKTDLANCLLGEDGSLMEKPHKCDECGTACATVDGLEMHKRKHTDNYPFRCEDCGKGFNSNVTLEGHLNKHRGIKPHVCVKCNKGFYHVSNLQRHFRYCDPEKQGEKAKKKMEEREHICAFCGKLLQTTGGLLLHMNKHTGQFPFKCSICEKGYNSNMLLKAHMDSHMNVKGFVCQHCGKNFRHKSNLNRHLSYCDPEKQPANGSGRFSCELCDKTYLRKESLTEHKISKHSSITFDCNVCGKVYDSRGSLFWHRTKSLCAKGITLGDPVTKQRKIKQDAPSTLMPMQAVEPPQQPLVQQQQQQQRQVQQTPSEVVIEFSSVSQEMLVASRHLFDTQPPHQQHSSPNNVVPVETVEQTSSLPTLETMQTSQGMDGSSKNMITFVPYQNVGQKTYFNFG